MKQWKIEIKLNKSSTYILPLLHNEVNFRFLSNLKNSYLINNEKELAFCVLYKFTGKPEFTKYEGELMNHELFKGHEDYGDHVLYKFKLTQEMEKGVKLFIEGKYSLFTKYHKDSISRFLREKGARNVEKIKKILNKDEGLRLQMIKDLGSNIDPEAELSSAPDLKLETFSNHLSKIEYKTGSFENEEADED